MAGTITGIGGGQQIWNLGNNLIDTSQLVQLELQTLEMKKTPYNNQKTSLTNEKAVYNSLKTQFSPFSQTFKDLAAFKGNEKKVTLSQDGYVSVQAGATAIAGTFNIEVTQLAERHQISSGSIDINAKPGAGTIKINGQPLTITADMTYKDLINTINNGNYDVSAYTLGDKMFISSIQEGTTINLEDGAEGILTKSKFVDNTGKILNQIPPQYAKYTINGVEITEDDKKTNTIDTIPGVTIHLEKVTEAGKAIKLTVEDSGVKDSVDIIKKMVSDYNKGVSAMDLFSGENGALQGQTVMQTIRQAMSDAVTFTQNGKYLFSFGIQVNKDGTLQVDETKLTNALKENPEAAKQFFFGVDGLGKQMDKKLDKIFGETGTIGEHVKSIDKQVTDLDRKIEDIDKKNKVTQEAIVDKYAKLEQQLAMLDTQLKSIQAMTKPKNDN